MHRYPIASPRQADCRPCQTFYLHQSLSQQQTLAPQMRKSLEILQAGTMELSQIITQALEINPVLEDITESVSLDEEGTRSGRGGLAGLPERDRRRLARPLDHGGQILAMDHRGRGAPPAAL